MKIDDYLAQHQQSLFEGVIEPLATDPTRVKITPVLSGSRCLCDANLVLEKDQIADVEPTDRSIACCGKLRRVVRVTLRGDARVPAGDVIAGILNGGDARASRRGGWDPTDPEVCQEEAIWHFKMCVNACRNAADPDACRAGCRARLAEDLAACNFGH